MGREARAFARIDDWEGEGKLLLETDELIFRGARRLALPIAGLQATAEDGWLQVRHGASRAAFDLGAAAPGWARAIMNPRTLIDKLDVRASHSVAIIGDLDGELVDRLTEKAASVESGPSAATVDVMLLAADEPAALAQLAEAARRISRKGFVWVVFPKGRKDIGHATVVAAAREAGLVDVKSARFSTTHTGLKFTVPRSART